MDIGEDEQPDAVRATAPVTTLSSATTRAPSPVRDDPEPRQLEDLRLDVSGISLGWPTDACLTGSKFEQLTLQLVHEHVQEVRDLRSRLEADGKADVVSNGGHAVSNGGPSKTCWHWAGLPPVLPQVTGSCPVASNGSPVTARNCLIPRPVPRAAPACIGPERDLLEAWWAELDHGEALDASMNGKFIEGSTPSKSTPPSEKMYWPNSTPSEKVLIPVVYNEKPVPSIWAVEESEAEIPEPEQRGGKGILWAQNLSTNYHPPAHVNGTRKLEDADDETVRLTECTMDEEKLPPFDTGGSMLTEIGPPRPSSRASTKPGTVKPGRRTSLFLSDDTHKDPNNLAKEDYNVEQLYYTSGVCQHVARADRFQNFTLGVIMANAVYIGVDADNNPAKTIADADIGFQICENAFCVYFTFEWFVRFGAFRYKRDCLRDMWFKFDSALVTMMIVETWLVPIAFAGAGNTGLPTGLVKMLRLLRLARMARLIRSMPELVAMIKGVNQASRAVGSALLLLAGLVYIYAILMFTLLKDVEEDENKHLHERFRRLGFTMWTLLIDGTFMDNVGLVSRQLIATDKYFELLLFMTFVLASALTVMNMLIGVLCEVVSAVAVSEKEDAQIKVVKENLLGLLLELDDDGSGMISTEEIRQVMVDEDALRVLGELKVDVENLVAHLDMLFEEKPELPLSLIMEEILAFRGDRTTTMKDIIEESRFNRWHLQKMLKATQDVNNVEKKVNGLDQRIKKGPPR